MDYSPQLAAVAMSERGKAGEQWSEKAPPAADSDLDRAARSQTQLLSSQGALQSLALSATLRMLSKIPAQPYILNPRYRRQKGEETNYPDQQTLVDTPHQSDTSSEAPRARPIELHYDPDKGVQHHLCQQQRAPRRSLLSPFREDRALAALDGQIA
jgi:hypothetical protein